MLNRGILWFFIKVGGARFKWTLRKLLVVKVNGNAPQRLKQVKCAWANRETREDPIDDAQLWIGLRTEARHELL